MLHNYSDLTQNEDAMTQVFTLLSAKELAPFLSVSSTFNLFASADPLWRFYTKRDFNLDIPTDIQPKKYYHSIKHQVAQEKEDAVYACIAHALRILASDFSAGLTTNKNLLSLFSEEQLSSVLNNKTLSDDDGKLRELRNNNFNEFITTIKIICYTQINHGMINFMKSKIEAAFAPFFEEAPLPSSLDTCLTLIDTRPPLYLLYNSGSMQALKMAVWKHPEAINQLTQALSDELYLLFNVQFMNPCTQKSEMIKTRIDNLHWLLSYQINVDKKVVFHEDTITTSRQAAHLCIAKITLANHIVDIAKDERIRKKITHDNISYLMELLHNTGIIKQNPLLANQNNYDTQELIGCGIDLGLAGLESPEDSHWLKIDEEIFHVMKKITNRPTQVMDDQMELLAANRS